MSLPKRWRDPKEEPETCDKCPRRSVTVVRYAGGEYRLCQMHLEFLQSATIHGGEGRGGSLSNRP